MNETGVITKEIFKDINRKIPNVNRGRIPKGFIERIPVKFLEGFFYKNF